jgi:quercetin dioxygenase-like cupin family protein
MHYVSTINPDKAHVPELYRSHSTGFRRAAYVDHTNGSVHMGTGICYLRPSGTIRPHVHAFEETFFIIEGHAILQLENQAHLLKPGHFGLIRSGVKHAWRCHGSQTARWLEMQSPQPRPPDHEGDTFFVGGDAPAKAVVPDLASDANRYLGFFDESQLPAPGSKAEMEGFDPTSGVAIKMFVDRSFGATHQSLFLIRYMPGAKIAPHDHPFEESYYVLSGEVEAKCDGISYRLVPDSVVWTSVGCIHSFENIGNEPVTWLETQAPLPPASEVFRFEHEWAHFRNSE